GRLLPCLLPAQVDLAGRGVPGELGAVRVLGDRQVERGVGLYPSWQRGDLGERAARGPIVNATTGNGRLEGAGRVPPPVGAATHDVAVVTPALADLTVQVGQPT